MTALPMTCGEVLRSESMGRGSIAPSRKIQFSEFGVEPRGASTDGWSTLIPSVGSMMATDSLLRTLILSGEPNRATRYRTLVPKLRQYTGAFDCEPTDDVTQHAMVQPDCVRL